MLANFYFKILAAEWYKASIYFSVFHFNYNDISQSFVIYI